MGMKVNEHEGHHITFNEEAVIPYNVTVTETGDITLVANGKTDIIDSFWWCQTCHEYVYPEDFGANEDPQLNWK